MPPPLSHPISPVVSSPQRSRSKSPVSSSLVDSQRLANSRPPSPAALLAMARPSPALLYSKKRSISLIEFPRAENSSFSLFLSLRSSLASQSRDLRLAGKIGEALYDKNQSLEGKLTNEIEEREAAQRECQALTIEVRRAQQRISAIERFYTGELAALQAAAQRSEASEARARLEAQQAAERLREAEKTLEDVRSRLSSVSSELSQLSGAELRWRSAAEAWEEKARESEEIIKTLKSEKMTIIQENRESEAPPAAADPRTPVRGFPIIKPPPPFAARLTPLIIRAEQHRRALKEKPSQPSILISPTPSIPSIPPSSDGAVQQVFFNLSFSKFGGPAVRPALPSKLFSDPP